MATERVDGWKIRELRLAARMSQRRLAQATDISHESVNCIERSEEPSTIYDLTAFKLAVALGVDVSAIRVNDSKRR
jgi:DNA-binding XRE family transcriptional regulator